MRPQFLLAALTPVALLLFAPGAAAAVHEVRIVSGPKFEPANIDIAVGDSVRWVAEVNGHTVTSDADGQAPWEEDGRFDQTVSTTAPYEHTFTEPGTFYYFCRPHSSFMHGSVTVTGSAASTSTSPSTSSSASFNMSTEDDADDVEDDDEDATTEGTPSVSGGVVVALAAIVALVRGRRQR